MIRMKLVIIMGRHDFIHEENIRKKIKWKKLYGKTCNRVVYEGFTLNNKPCGQGTTYYANGEKHLEGKFYIKGFVEGKEYYRNGQVRFEGKCVEYWAYGPNYPIEGNWYDMDGKLLYSGEFKKVARGSLGWPVIVCPEGFGHIMGEDTDLEFLRCPDVEEVRKEREIITAYDESKYPLTYEQFKEHLLRIFVEREFDYDRTFSCEEKQEFVDNHDFDFHEYYNSECEKYDKNQPNLLELSEDQIYPVDALFFDCDIYYISKEVLKEESEEVNIDESKYPLTYSLFKEKMIGSLIKHTNRYVMSKDEVISDLIEFFENDPEYLLYSYHKKCEEYDELIADSRTVQAKYVFCDDRISGDTFNWGTWLDYWLFL